MRRKIKSPDELNNNVKKYFLELSNIYSRIIKESPDNITIDGKYYDYDRTPNTYTGFIDGSGGYVISKHIVGHGNLSYEITKLGEDELEEVKELFSKLKTTAKSLHELKSIVSNHEKIRIWADQKVFSMWSRYKPIYKESIINAITATGGDYKVFKYDNDYSDYENMPTYDKFLISDLTPEERREIEEREAKQRQSERELANRLAGITPKRSIDMDYSKPRTPTWMNRQGD